LQNIWGSKQDLDVATSSSTSGNSAYRIQPLVFFLAWQNNFYGELRGGSRGFTTIGGLKPPSLS